MHETAADLERLQKLLDEGAASASRHQASIVTPGRRLNARQVVAYLQGVKHVAFAVVNAAGEPRVAPLDSLFVRGRFLLGTAESSARMRSVRRNPACSLTHFSGEEVAIVVHGQVQVLERGRPDERFAHGIWVDTYDADPYSLAGDVVLFTVEPARMWTFAPDPSRFPE